MSKVSYPLKLPASLKAAAARLAKEDGVSLNQWITVAIAQKIGAVETSSEFFRRRADRATGKGFMRLLEKVPDLPPVEGDEISGTPRNIPRPVAIAETNSFFQDAKKIFSNEEHDRLIEHLATFPEVGDIIPGTGGLRELPWTTSRPDEEMAFVIYMFVEETMIVFLVALYKDRNELNPSETEKRKMRDLIKGILRGQDAVNLRWIVSRKI